MGVLQDASVERVFHYAPLHYFPFIARSKALLCKPSLAAAGFSVSHLRSKSRCLDVSRGFGGYTHLTLDSNPNILKAKLAAGFPHIQLHVPVEIVETHDFSLCRYNVAMTRYLRRNGDPGHAESSTNGRYYGNHQIPIARTNSDMAAMLRTHLNAQTMIEVLIHGDLELSDEITVVCYSPDDAEIVRRVLAEIRSPWRCRVIPPPDVYPRNPRYATAVGEFVDRALAEPVWRGNGLEFDRI